MLNDYTQNINRQVDGRSKFRPIDLYTVGYNPPEDELQPVVPLDNHNTPEEIQNFNRNYHRTRAIRLTNGRRNRFQVGDLVRVNMMDLSADYRRIRKEDLSNVSAGNQVSVAPRTIERVDRMNSRN
jgi:hypothetical protein